MHDAADQQATPPPQMPASFLTNAHTQPRFSVT
jgi:hypothetical protein